MQRGDSLPDFYGGLYLPEYEESKELTDNKIEEITPRSVFIEESRVSLAVGEEAKISVQIGDEVKIGQPLSVGSNLLPLSFASVSGTVRSIGTVGDSEQRFIEIENNRKNEKAELREDGFSSSPSSGKRDIWSYTREQLLLLMERTLLTGHGGAGFPAYKKYQTKKNIDCVLINICECEPYLTCDRALTVGAAQDVIEGAVLLSRAANSERIVVCIEDADLITPLSKTVKAAFRDVKIQKADEHSIIYRSGSEDFSSSRSRSASSPSQSWEIELLRVGGKYPSGSERQLIKAAVGREVPFGGLPADAGVLVSNAATAAAFRRSVNGGYPAVRRIVTVSGAITKPKNLLVPEGTKIAELAAVCGEFTEPLRSGRKQAAIILGGPMTGEWATLDTPVPLSVGGVTVLPAIFGEEGACIRCGRCERSCPAGIVPYQIDRADRAVLPHELLSLSAGACIACGLCSYVCPAHRRLTAHTLHAAKLARRFAD